MAAKKTPPSKKARGAEPPEEMYGLPVRLRAVYDKRKRAGLRQHTLAERSGVSQAVISSLMKEPLTKSMTVAVLARVAKALNVSLDYLIIGVGLDVPKLRRSVELPPVGEVRFFDESTSGIPSLYSEQEPAPTRAVPDSNKRR